VPVVITLGGATVSVSFTLTTGFALVGTTPILGAPFDASGAVELHHPRGGLCGRTFEERLTRTPCARMPDPYPQRRFGIAWGASPSSS
jgi:hypothetical protein